MDLKSKVCIWIIFLGFGACAQSKMKEPSTAGNIELEIQELTRRLVDAEKEDDLQYFLSFYEDRVISMPEYQPILTGKDEISVFYEEIFKRQEIRTLQKNAEEIFRYDSTLVEFGTFTKEYVAPDNNQVINAQNGKYCHVWNLHSDGSLKIKGEAYGFFHPIEKPEALTVLIKNTHASQSDTYEFDYIPLELRAYNALNEKYVTIRDGALRSEIYAEDGKYMPFQEPTVSGKDIKPYLMEYSSRGTVSIDSVSVYTYHYEYFPKYILEYSRFKVRWSREGTSGRTEGKGFRVWKRQDDGSLKMYRQIGTHNLIN